MKCLKCGKKIKSINHKCMLDLRSKPFVLICSLNDKTVDSFEKLIRETKSTNPDSKAHESVSPPSKNINAVVSAKNPTSGGTKTASNPGKTNNTTHTRTYSGAKTQKTAHQANHSGIGASDLSPRSVFWTISLIILVAIVAACLIGPSVITGFIMAGMLNPALQENIENSIPLITLIDGLPAIVSLLIWSIIFCFPALSGQFIIGTIYRSVSLNDGYFFPIAGQILSVLNIVGFTIAHFIGQPDDFGFFQLLLVILIFGWPLILCWTTYGKIYD